MTNQGNDEALQPIRNRSAAGGVNTRVFATDIAEDQAVSLRNIDVSTPGQRQKRQGTTLTATGITNGPIMALREYKANNDNTVLLAVAPGATWLNLYSWDGTGNTFSDVGILSGYTAGNDVEIVIATDVNIANPYIAVVSKGEQDVDRWFYDGSALTQSGFGSSSNPGGHYFTYAGSRAFGTAAEENSLRSRVFFSDPAAGATFPTPGTNSIEFGGGTKQRIVAIKEFRQNEIIIFMDDRIEVLLTPPSSILIGTDTTASWSRQVIHTTIGCGSRRSIINVGEDIYFADQYGNIRSLARTINDAGQGVRSLPVSENIKDDVARLNPAAIGNIIAETYDRFYVVGFPMGASTTANEVWLLDTAESSARGSPVWQGPWDGWDPRCFAVATLEVASDDDDKQPTLYYGNATGHVFRTFRGFTDDGSDIVYQEETRRFTVDGGYERDATYERLEVYAVGTGNATICVETNKDALGYEVQGYLSVLGDTPQLPIGLPFQLGGTGIAKRKFSLNDLERMSDLQLRFTCTTSEEVKVLGYSLFRFPESFEWDVDTD